MALINKLSAIGDAIRAKTGKTELLTLAEMPAEIEAIETGGGDLPEEALIISGHCNYKFAYGGWNWFIENYGDKITTKDIVNCSYMFANNLTLTEIPFDINGSSSVQCDNSNMFYTCSKLKSIPKMNSIITKQLPYLFFSCYMLRELPEDLESYFDWRALDSYASAYNGSQAHMFDACASLRSIPMGFLSHGNPYANYTYSYFYYGFNNCYALDELVELPIPYSQPVWANNSFYNTFYNCHRLKRLTFAMPDGEPYGRSWKSQTIDLSSYVGYVNSIYSITGYNSGITADKEVKDDATYQALKNDPDWFTCNIAYSRYNHDSAVETINSLPNTSAYLATAGGTNTIKFKGASGSATDGGAINTLTAEEIAVATAKGWTVTIS